MIVKINEYIESGILESFVMGSASDNEVRELLKLKEQHPQIQEALYELEIGFEDMAKNMAIPPSANTWTRIETEINEVIKRSHVEALSIERGGHSGRSGGRRKGNLIDIESTTSHIRVHKLWRWVLGFIFLLAKIFLVLALYFYFANRSSEQQIQELKTKLQQEHKH